MQVQIAVDGAKGPNPDYNKRQPITADNCPERDVPKGTIIDHPDCWRLCLAEHHLSDDWLAEPYDDEAKAIVLPLREAEANTKAQAESQFDPAAAGADATTPAPKVKSRPPRQADATT